MIERAADLHAGLRLAVTLLFMALVLTLSVIPGRARQGDSVFVWLVATTPTPLQKIMHFVCYGALAFLWAWTLEAIDPVALRLLAALLLAVGFGVAMEWAQTFVPGRFGALHDALLNAGGAIVGLVAAAVVL